MLYQHKSPRKISPVSRSNTFEALEFDASFLEEDDHMHDQSIQALGVKLKGQLHQEKLNHFFGEVLKLVSQKLGRFFSFSFSAKFVFAYPKRQ